MQSDRCPHCGYPGQIVWVHGHGQCSVCGNNVAPCCSGEQACPTIKKGADHD